MRTHLTVKRWVESAALNIIVELIMFGSGLMEAWNTLGADMASANFGGHHGIAVFRLFSVVRALPDLFSGMEYATKNVE